MSHPLWTLYNSVTEQTIENLDVHGCHAALSGVPANEWNVWFAWREGLADWKPILELPEFESLKAHVAHRPPLSLVTDTPVPETAASPDPAPTAQTMAPFAPADVPEAIVNLSPEATATDFAPHAPVDVGAFPAEEPVIAPHQSPVEAEHFEKTHIGYDPADEDTKTAEFTATQFDLTEVTEVTSHGHFAPEAPAPDFHAVAPAPVPQNVAAATEPQAPAPEAFTPSPTEHAEPVSPAVAATADDGTHLFWMTEGSDGALTPAHLDEMTGSHVYIGPAPVQLSPESESLAAQAESMPESADAVMGKVETPSRQASFPLASGSAPGGEQSPSAASGQDRRKYPRFDIRYRVIVRNDNLTFRTFSRNISLGGVALEMPVPEALLGSECQIYVGNPRTGENIRFSGKLVANRNDSQFFVFLKSSPDSLTKLQKWVEAHQSGTKRAV